MGNRGCLHDPHGNVKKRWAIKPWVTCLLDFKGRHRQIMAPGRYTELFFLDELTALAAGHRPCGTCQKARYDEFKRVWLEMNEDELGGGDRSIKAVDTYLHSERVCSAGRDVLWRAQVFDLPDGSMFSRTSDANQAWMKWGGRLHPDFDSF